MALAEIGFNLVLTDVDFEKLELLRDRIQNVNPLIHILIYRMDVTSKPDLEGVYSKLEEESISISALVNNAAINPKSSELQSKMKFEEYREEEWLRGSPLRGRSRLPS